VYMYPHLEVFSDGSGSKVGGDDYSGNEWNVVACTPLRVLQWAREHGCPWDSRTRAAAAGCTQVSSSSVKPMTSARLRRGDVTCKRW
jgi:hypothetical protein